jgi:hypothetical protein
MLRRVTDLLVDGANVYTDEHVALFDDVIGRLSRGIEAKVRAELSNRLAPIANAWRRPRNGQPVSRCRRASEQ